MKKIFTALMALIMLVPTLWMAVVKTQPMVIEENRERAARPALHEGYNALIDTGEYAKGFSEWYNDNYGLRDVMIRTKNQLEYSVFGIANGVYIGEDGYMEYKDSVDSQGRCEELTQADFDQFFAYIDTADRILSEKGIKFYVMLPPLKNTAFPERFESVPVHRPSPTAYERLCRQMNDRYPDIYVDVIDELRRGEERAPVYFKTDFHWNNHGAAMAFAPLVNRIAGKTIYDPYEKYNIGSFDDFKGTQLNNFCILEDISETGYGTETVEPVTSKLNGVGIRSSSLLMQNKAKAPLGKLLIIGDSYSNYVISYNSGIADCFSEINYLNMNYGDFDNLIIDITKEQADYVLFESIETAMPSYNQKFEQLMSGLG